MISDSLNPGLKFAKDHNLSQQDIMVLVPFLEKSYTRRELAIFLGKNNITLDNSIQRLKMKGLLVVKSSGFNGEFLYGFNQSQLE